MMEPRVALVSVVMGVHNGASALRPTLDSVLEQKGVDFEFIVVDDGSTDGTAEILARYSKADSRIRVLTQAGNLGLTEALKRGCEEARGEYIARQDCGDQSLPDRFRRQLEWLESVPDSVMVSCHARTIGLFGETVFESRISTDALSSGLRGDGSQGFLGPSHHGSVMMRVNAYRRAGGYRQPFVVAQDLDLWLRLAELGTVGVVDFMGYEADTSPAGISAQRLGLQKQLGTLAAELARARRSGCMEDEILRDFECNAARRFPEPKRENSDYRHAAHLYFLGRCMRHRDREIARRYFRAGIARCPWHLRSWYGLARTWI